MAGTKTIWMPMNNREVEDIVKSYKTCLVSGKSLKHQKPKNDTGNMKTIIERG